VIYPSGSSDPYAANVWRGKLSSVDGFSLGHGPWELKRLEDDK
jgi:hypothetical protein